jgi:CBS domain-containing protein
MKDRDILRPVRNQKAEPGISAGPVILRRVAGFYFPARMITAACNSQIDLIHINRAGAAVDMLAACRWFARFLAPGGVGRNGRRGVTPMMTGEICNRTVAFVYRHTRLSEAARLMREHHVGSLVVVDEDARGRIPVGIITDRDIVIEVLVADLDYRALSAGEIMSKDLVVTREHDNVLDALKLMRARGIRRLPVVSRAGTLAGIVTVDDLLEIVSEQLGDLVKAIAGEQAREARVRA